MRLLLAMLALLALVLGALWSVTRSGTPRSAGPAAPHARERRVEDVAALPATEAAARERPGPASVSPADSPTDSARTPLVASSPPSFPHVRLSGRVQHADGRPAAGLTLEVRAQGASLDGRPLATLPSADDGSFAVECPGLGPFRLRAHRSSLLGPHLEATLADVAAGARDLLLVLPPVTRLRGRVVDERGEPVRSFRIELERDGARLLRQSLFARDGAFETSEFLQGPATLVLSSPGHVASEHEIALPMTEPLTLTLVRGCTVRGVVLRPDGTPCSRARVELRGFEADLTDARGAFALSTAPGRRELCASATDCAPSPALTLDLSPGEERSDLVLELGALARPARESEERLELEAPRTAAFGERSETGSVSRARAETSERERPGRGPEVFVQIRPPQGSSKVTSLEAIDLRGLVFVFRRSNAPQEARPDPGAARPLWFRQRALPPGDYLLRAWSGERCTTRPVTIPAESPYVLELQLP